MQLRLHKLIADDSPHLFQSQEELGSRWLFRIREHGEMRRTDAEPFRFIDGVGRLGQQYQEDPNSKNERENSQAANSY